MTNQKKVPQHIAIIMDGNGRWAKKNKVPGVAGHNAGMEAMKKVVEHADHRGIKQLTVYAFSTENWKRTQEEITGIFNLLVLFIDRDLRRLHEKNVKVTVLGDYTPLPPKAVQRLDKTLELTKDNTGLQLNIALNYGSRKEITQSAIALCEKVQQGQLLPEEIDESLFEEELMTASFSVPDPDLVIRTSGEMRLSNFLLWQSAYSELVFSQVLWPDFSPEELDRCIEVYQKRQRRFGGRI